MNKLKKYITCFILSIIFILGTQSINVQNSYATSGVPTIKFDTSSKDVGFKNPTGSKEFEQVKGSSQKISILNKVLEKGRVVVLFLGGIGILTSVGLFIINFMNLANSKGNPQARQKAVNGLIACAIATAGLGSVGLISKLFYNFLQL